VPKKKALASTTEPVTNSPIKWVADHTRRYIESGGKNGHRWNGQDTLLLVTRGRKSGQLRRTALIYGRDGERYVVVGSNGGKPKHPDWYWNLQADPAVEVQVGAEIFKARAQVAQGKERARLWALMAKIFPTYSGFSQKTSRPIPVIILERI
jgi:deazaflavin-dependent oxidoreductase (nitroreductase family)